MSLGLVTVLISYSLFTIPSTFTLPPFYSIPQAPYAADGSYEKCKKENNCVVQFAEGEKNPPGVDYCDPPHYVDAFGRLFKYCYSRWDGNCPVNTQLQDIGGVLQCPAPCPPGERCSNSDESNCTTPSHILMEDGTCFPISCGASGRGSLPGSLPGYINSEGDCEPVNPPPPLQARSPTAEGHCARAGTMADCREGYYEMAKGVWDWACEAIPLGGRVPLGWVGLCPD